MAKNFIRPKDPNFYTVHRRIRDDSRVYLHFKDCIEVLDGTHIHVFPLKCPWPFRNSHVIQILSPKTSAYIY